MSTLTGCGNRNLPKPADHEENLSSARLSRVRQSCSPGSVLANGCGSMRARTLPRSSSSIEPPLARASTRLRTSRGVSAAAVAATRQAQTIRARRKKFEIMGLLRAFCWAGLADINHAPGRRPVGPPSSQDATLSHPPRQAKLPFNRRIAADDPYNETGENPL